jgi:hypothetical protein
MYASFTTSVTAPVVVLVVAFRYELVVGLF